MAGACIDVRVVPLEACGSVWGVWGVSGRANGSLEPREKHMAGACIDVRFVALEGHVYSCKSCCHGKAGSVWGVVRVVATGGLEAFGGFEAGQTAVLNPLKTGWQGHV